jgi:TPR repeat protein
MLRKQILLALVLGTAALVICVSTDSASAGLKSNIQKELDGNPFLLKEGVKLEVVEEKNGYVTIEMCEGSRALRKAINEGLDVLTSQIEQSSFWNSEGGKSARKSLNAIRRSLNYINKLDGVKEILVTSRVHTQLDQAEDLANNADEHCKTKTDRECFELWLHSANMGNPRAQANVGLMLLQGQIVERNASEGLKWLTTSAENGNPLCQYYLGLFYFQGKDVQQDFRKGVYWLEKAVEKDEPQAMNTLAWYLATCKENKFHNGKKAVELASRAISIEEAKWNYHDTLAAAYARDGRFKEAVLAEEHAIALLNKQEDFRGRERRTSDAQKRLNLYRNGHPYTQE